MNSSTALNRIYLDPPQFGWTAVGGIANVLEPHERARRVDPAAERAGGDEREERHYAIIEEAAEATAKREAAAEAEAEAGAEAAGPEPEPDPEPTEKKRNRRKGKRSEGPRRIGSDAPEPEPEPEIRPARISVRRLREGVLDVHSYHRGRAGQEPRGAEGELLAPLDPIDSNHDWIPSRSAAVKIRLDFPLVDDADEGGDGDGGAIDGSRFRFRDAIPWDLLSPSAPSPEEFAADLAAEHGLSFRTAAEIAESVSDQIREHVRRKANRFYPPVVVRDAYGADRPDRQFGPAEDAIGECFRGTGARAAAEGREGSGRRGRCAVISRSRNDGPAGAKKVKREKSRVRPAGQVKPQRGSIEVIPKDKVPKANSTNDPYAAQCLDRAKSESQRIVSECKARGDAVLWHAQGEVCHICHNRKPLVLTFHCGSHSYCDYHCASRLSFRCKDYDPSNPAILPIDHCPVCTLQCTCSKCIRRLEGVKSKLQKACESQNRDPEDVLVPNILELCNARLTEVPEAPVEPKFSPCGGGAARKKGGRDPSGPGAKRSRPEGAGGGEADPSRSARSSPPVESGDAGPAKKRKPERQPSSRPPTRVRRVDPTEFPREFLDGKDMDPAEEGDRERRFTPFGSAIPDRPVAAGVGRNYQQIIPLPLTLPRNFDYCVACNEGGELAGCSKCPRAYHSTCLAKDGGGMENGVCHRCIIDSRTAFDEDKDLSNLPSNQVIKSAYDNTLEDFAFNEKILELLVEIVNRLKVYDFGHVFAEPVNTMQVPNYLDVIKAPMDYGTIVRKLESGCYPTEGCTDFKEEMNATEEIILHALCDIEQVHHNCILFNQSGSCYHRIGCVHSTKWTAFYQKHVEDRLPAPVRANLVEFRAKLKQEIESQVQVRILPGTNSGNRANVAIGVFDPATKKVVKQYTSKTAACRAALMLKKAGYECEYDLDEKNAKGIIDKSNKEVGVLLFGYRWIAMDRLRGGKFELEEQTDGGGGKQSPVSSDYARSNSLDISFFKDDALVSPTAGNILVLKVDTVSGSGIRGFESVEAAYNDWSEARRAAVHLDESIGNDMASFQQHFLRGAKTINGVAWRMVEREAAGAGGEAPLSPNKAIIDQEYAARSNEYTNSARFTSD